MHAYVDVQQSYFILGEYSIVGNSLKNYPKITLSHLLIIECHHMRHIMAHTQTLSHSHSQTHTHRRICVATILVTCKSN